MAQDIRVPGMDMQVSEISIYPVKSCAGHGVNSVMLDRFGPSGDRRWMVVDENGDFLTQREYPELARVVPTPAPGGLVLAAGYHGGAAALEVAIPGADSEHLSVGVWGDRVAAKDAGAPAAAWFSELLERPARLVYMGDECQRPVDPEYAEEGETVSFADGFPLLLISRAALDFLNSKLSVAVPMNRFRPNIVVEGCAPHAEDGWRRIRIGPVELAVVKPCARCVIPSIDQASCERDPEILRVLSSYRRRAGADGTRQVYFGQNLIYRAAGRIGVGDPVEVLA